MQTLSTCLAPLLIIKYIILNDIAIIVFFKCVLHKSMYVSIMNRSIEKWWFLTSNLNKTRGVSLCDDKIICLTSTLNGTSGFDLSDDWETCWLIPLVMLVALDCMMTGFLLTSYLKGTNGINMLDDRDIWVNNFFKEFHGISGIIELIIIIIINLWLELNEWH